MTLLVPTMKYMISNRHFLLFKQTCNMNNTVCPLILKCYHSSDNYTFYYWIIHSTFAWPSFTTDVHKESCHQDISIEGDNPSTQASFEIVNTKCRGPTRCAYINKLEEKFKIHINERNQPIGPNSMKLAWLLGALAREMVPMIFFYWWKIPNQLKEN